jgi:hypothetical protein
MKNILIFLVIILNCLNSQSQKTFFSTYNNISLNNSNGGCTSPGSTTPNSFNVNVSGVGTLTSLNQLLLVSVKMNDCGLNTTVTLDRIQIRIMAPTGQCIGIYSGGLSGSSSGEHNINLVSSTTCLNNPNVINHNSSGAPMFSTGNNGYFNAYFCTTTICTGATNYNFFNGLNANGTWKIIFSETSTSDVPCVDRIFLTFGNPNVINQNTTGDNCSNPIIWDGTSAICGTTSGMTGSIQMPGSFGGQNSTTFGTISSATCEWNARNNNDVWIKYTATASNTCLTISGIIGGGNNLQSIVVTDANVDNDNNPCTGPLPSGGNDSRWKLVSCPRPLIYGLTTGSALNQQHCFTSEIGKTYYLVVDGEGGALSKFWIWGSTFNNVLPLNEKNETVRYPRIIYGTKVSMIGYNLITDVGNDRLNQDIIIYDGLGRIVYRTKRLVKGYSEFNLKNFIVSGFYIINVFVEDKKYSNFTFKIIK